MKMNNVLSHEAIFGFYALAMIQAEFSAEEFKKGWDAMEVILDKYETEDAENIFGFLIGRNIKIKKHLKKMLEEGQA